MSSEIDLPVANKLINFSFNAIRLRRLLPRAEGALEIFTWSYEPLMDLYFLGVSVVTGIFVLQQKES